MNLQNRKEELEKWLEEHKGEPVIGEAKEKFDEWKKLKEQEEEDV